MSYDVSKDVAKKISSLPFKVPAYSRYMKISPFGKSQIVKFNFFEPCKGGKVVDDSHYHIRQTPQLVRAAIASGSLNSVGVFDFDDGKDNGFNPALRKIAPDAVEVDEAVQVIKDSAKKAKDEEISKQLEKEQKDLNDKALKGLSALGDIVDSDSSDDLPE